MRLKPEEALITVVSIQVKRHVVPRTMVPHLDPGALEDNDRTQAAVSRRVYLDRRIGVRVEDFGPHQAGER